MQNTLYREIQNSMKGAPVNLEQLCTRIGVELEKTSLDENISGMLEKVNDTEYKITVNTNKSLGHQRFTIAHEIGHLVMHRHLIGEGLDDRAYRSTTVGKYDNSKITNTHEAEANKFAASLLLPKDLVLKAVIEYGKENIEALKDHFQVSSRAMEIRLSTLMR
jgi:Zn-dependent peptidase ImmA (M78 family)